nr:GGDEF domain-containing protein [Phytoactinopolyspora mesophila]
MPRPALILVLVVNASAVIVTAATAFLVDIDRGDLARFALLAGCAWAAIELTRHIERIRSYQPAATVAYVDSTTVWSFAAIIILPPALASGMVAVTYILSWARVKTRRAIPYRWTYSAATVLLGTHVAGLVLAAGMSNYPGVPDPTSMTGFKDLGVVVLAATVRWVFNTGLVMTAIALANPTARSKDLFNNFSEQFLEAGALGLGLAVAVIVTANPFALPGILIAIIALHRSLLVSQYRQASRVDAKTGLATAGRWHEFAEGMLKVAQQRNAPLGLLIIDLDRFKAVNDTYGHPFGDKVLRTVADELRAEVRELDACGRWGGEEFTILLPDIGTREALYRVAERIRLRIQSVAVDAPDNDGTGTPVYLSVSIGGTLYSAKDHGTLDDLLLAADTALYKAKNSGRNTVRLSANQLAAPTEPTETDPPATNLPHADSA